MIRQDLGGHGFARAALAAEQHRDAQPTAAAFAEAPVFVDFAARINLIGDVAQEAHLLWRQNDVVPGCLGDDVLRQQIAPAPQLFIVGHTHQPLVRTIDDTLVVNVGAVGLPFDLDPRACYAQLMWHADRWTAEIVRVEYDRAQADRDYDETGFSVEAGPIARLIRDELAQARSNLFEWTHAYEAAVVAGQMTMAESVTRFLGLDQPGRALRESRARDEDGNAD